MAILSLWVFVYNVLLFDRLVDGHISVFGHLVPAAIAFWYLSDLVNVSFNRNWGRAPQAVAAGAALLVFVVGWTVDGQAWSLAFSWFLFLFIGAAFGVFAVSFLLAGLFAVPG